MAKNQTKSIRPNVIQEDIDSYAALTAIGDYESTNPGFSVTSGLTLKNIMRDKQDAVAVAKSAYKTAMDNATKAEWDFHNYMLGVKDQVAAQFGKDSNEYQSLGLKKKSEYASRRRKTQPKTTAKAVAAAKTETSKEETPVSA